MAEVDFRYFEIKYNLKEQDKHDENNRHDFII